MKVTLPQKTCTLLRIRAAIVTVLLLSVPVYLGISVSAYAFIAAGALAAACAFTVFFYIPRLVNGASIVVSDKGVTVKYGVFFKTEQIMPALRLIYTETHQTPLARRMGLCSVTFSGARARIIMPEISAEDAKTITQMCRRARSGGQNE